MLSFAFTSIYPIHKVTTLALPYWFDYCMIACMCITTNLNKCTFCVSNVSIKLPISDPVLLRTYPSELTTKLVIHNELMHCLDLDDLFPILRFLHTELPCYYNKVYKLSELWTFCKPLDQPSDVFDSIQACHREDDWLLFVFQIPSAYNRIQPQWRLNICINI